MVLRTTAFRFALAVILAGGAGSACDGAPAEPREQKQVALDAAAIQGAVTALASRIEAEYFDAALATRIAAALRENLAKGRYAAAAGPGALADLVTADMHAVAQDRHLSLAVAKAPTPASPAPQETRAERGRRENFGVQKVEILPGNVGYLRMTGFYRPEEAREVIAQAMAVLSHADALILDFRDHGGGATPTVALFTSYFLEGADMPLFAIAPRPPEEPSTYRSEPAALPHRNASRPTFVLTSPRTASGGEAVAYLLQERHRALVIGEPTWGGANQVPNPRPIAPGFQAYIPNGHMGTALTGRNWEGAGVIPDVPIPADQALRAAQVRALRGLCQSAPEGARLEILKKELALLER